MKDSSSTFQMSRILFECCCWVIILLMWTPQTTASLEDETTNLEEWQRCDYFVAPTSTGWGVYAGRFFGKDEMVSLPTIFLPLEGKPQAVQHTVLDDYIYGAEGLPGLVPGFHSNVLFGPDMIYNHSPEPNVLYMNFGITTGFSARKNIREGEQLFTTYGDGTLWFDHRGIEMKFVNDDENDNAATTTSTLRDNELPLMKHIFCSKIRVGLGTPGFQQLPPVHRDFLRDNYDPEVLERLFGAPFDAKFDNARAKVPIAKGERIELGVGLAVHADKLHQSPLGALVIRYSDFSEEHQQILQRLRESGNLKIQTQSPETNWKRVDETLDDWEDLAILPVSGGLIHVQRVGGGIGNCRLVVKPAFSELESVTVILELVATEDIALGEVLAMGDIKPRKASSVEEGLLYQTLYQTSQL